MKARNSGVVNSLGQWTKRGQQKGQKRKYLGFVCGVSYLFCYLGTDVSLLLVTATTTKKRTTTTQPTTTPYVTTTPELLPTTCL